MTLQQAAQLMVKHQTPLGNPITKHMIKLHNDSNRSQQQNSDEQLRTVGTHREVGEQEHKGTIHGSAESAS